jgi:hypothetical protein
MDIKNTIKGSELYYTAGKLIDGESFEEMVDELTEEIGRDVTASVMLYHKYLLDSRKKTCETKRKLEEDGWKNVCLEPNLKTFLEFCKNPEI